MCWDIALHDKMATASCRVVRVNTARSVAGGATIRAAFPPEPYSHHLSNVQSTRDVAVVWDWVIPESSPMFRIDRMCCCSLVYKSVSDTVRMRGVSKVNVMTARGSAPLEQRHSVAA